MAIKLSPFCTRNHCTAINVFNTLMTFLCLHPKSYACFNIWQPIMNSQQMQTSRSSEIFPVVFHKYFTERKSKPRHQKCNMQTRHCYNVKWATMTRA